MAGEAIICSFYAGLWFPGFTINCPESGDTVMVTDYEIGPTCYFATTAFFETC